MKTKYPFTIVNRPGEHTSSPAKSGSSLTSALKKQSKALAESMERIPPGILEAMLKLSSDNMSLNRKKSSKGSSAKPGKVATRKIQSGKRKASAATLPGELIKAAERAVAGVEASTVGILDLGAWVSRLPRLLNVMNSCQDRLVFFELQTPVPAGLIKTKEPLMKWAQQQLGRKLRKAEADELMRNMLADEFFYFAESVRSRNKLDMLIAVTPAMIAFSDAENAYWNYYAVGEGNASIVSTCDLREYSAKAGRPYEAAIGMLVVGQIFALRNGIEYHDETRGCIFDFNENREDLVASVKGMSIEAECMAKFKSKEDAKAARKLIAALARMKELKNG